MCEHESKPNQQQSLNITSKYDTESRQYGRRAKYVISFSFMTVTN
jgi:hypothetical protein